MNEPRKEVTALNSHAALISEMTNYRRHLRVILAESKKVLRFLPVQERMAFLEVLIDAERDL